MASGLEYAELQKQNLRGRLKKKLAEKQPSVADSEADDTTEISAANGDTHANHRTEEVTAAARAAMERISAEEERVRAKAAAGGAAVTEDMKAHATKVNPMGKVSVTTQDGAQEMTVEEKNRLSAAIGTGKNQKVRAWVNASGEEATIDDSVVPLAEGAAAALVFSGCKGCKYSIQAYCAKIFVRHCVDLELVLEAGCRILTSTIEVDHCVRTAIRVHTRVCTMQVEQCQSIIVDISSRQYFGNEASLHKGRVFGNDGMLIWAGIDDLRLRIGDDVLICDYGLEAALDKTVLRETTQFKVHYDSTNKLCSEKVTRLVNGFPSTRREEDEFNRRENAQMQALAERVGISIHRKEDLVGKKTKPNESCPCGSGKKYKKCCWS